jgi:hypothetical protein
MKIGKIYSVDNLLSEKELTSLRTSVDTFTPLRSPGEPGNYYYQKPLDVNDYSTFIGNIEEYYQGMNSKYLVELEGLWINRVTTLSNTSDNFHVDASELSTVTLLNDDYEGGYFNYINEKEEDIQFRGKKYTTLIFNGKFTKHRVIPVSKGTRWSLVTFWQTKIKTTKTLL